MKKEFTPVRSVVGYAVSFNGDVLWKYETRKEAEAALCWASWRYNMPEKDMNVVEVYELR
jgi:hypothetical protein